MRVKVKHIRNVVNGQISNLGGMTVAAMVDDDFNVIKYGVAKCHTNDNFVKRLGLVKATGRMKSSTEFLTTNVKYDELVRILKDSQASKDC